MGTTSRNGIYGITIEGVCKATTTGDGLYRFVWSTAASRLPAGLDLSWDSAGLYQPGLASWPSQLDFGVDFLTGTPTLGGQSYQLTPTELLLGQLWTISASAVADLASPIGAADTDVALENGISASLQNTVICLERELILLGTLASTVSGVSTYTGCSRAHAGSLALPHGQEDTSDLQCFASPSADSLPGRVVRLFFLPADATGYSDEEAVWTGVLAEVGASSSGVAHGLTLEVANILSLVAGTQLFREPWRAAAGGGRASALGLPMAGYTGALEGVFMVDGQYAVVAPYRIQGLRATVDLSQAAPLLGATPLPADTTGMEVREFVTTDEAQPASSATPDEQTLPLSRRPGVACLQLLTTTAAGGTAGSNGDYDLGIDNLAGGIRADYIDTTAFLAWDEAYGLAELDRLAIGADGPESLLEVVQAKILHPRGAVLTQNASGQLAPVQLGDTPAYDSSAAIAASQILGTRRDQSRRLRQAIDQVLVSFNHTPGVGADTLSSTDAYKRRRLPAAQRGQLQINAGAQSSAGEALALSTLLLARFHRPPPSLYLEVDRTADHWPGDVVRVTDTRALANGARGVTSGAYLVTGRREVISGPGVDASAPGTHYIGLSMLYVGGIYNQVGRIAPAATITAWNAGTSKANVNLRDFTSDTSPVDADALAFEVGDAVKIVDQYGTDRETGITISAIFVTGANVTLSGVTITPVAGDVIVTDDWSAQSAAQRARWASVADSSNELGGDAANTYGYTTG